MNRVKVGKAAEFIFIAQCLLSGLECYTPVSEDGRVDVVVGSTLCRCQVKQVTPYSSTSRSKGISIRKVGVNSRTNTKCYSYTASDVDYMVGVDTDSYDVYVVPMTALEGYRRSISCPILTKLGYKNNIDILKTVNP